MKKIIRTVEILMAVLALLLSTSCTKSTPYTNHRLQWWLEDINWNQRRKSYSGDGVRIAVIDSGIDKDHPDLISKIEFEYRIPSLLKENPKQPLNHGTAVAGIIVATPFDKNGVLGIAPQAKIISIDVTDELDESATMENVILGIEYAVAQNVNIINISYGFSEYSQKLREAVKIARNKGILVVAPASDGTTEGVFYPSDFDEVLAVGARDKKSHVISPKSQKNGVIYLPGEHIITTASNEKKYASFDGVTMATPMLSGVLALMLEKNVNINVDKIVNIINTNVIFDVDMILRKI